MFVTNHHRRAAAWLVGLAWFVVLSASAEAALPDAVAARLAWAATQPGSQTMEMAVVQAIASNPDSVRDIVAEAVRLAPDAAPAVVATASRWYPGFAVTIAEAGAGRPARVAQRAPSAVPTRPRTERRERKSWFGEVELGGSRSTGNTEEEQLSIAGYLGAQYGNWSQDAHVNFDFGSSDDETTTQRLVIDLKSRYALGQRLYALGFVEYEDDRFSGFKYRFTETLGLGYRLLDRRNLTFDVEAGPGARQSRLNVTDETESEITANLGAFFVWEISDTANLTNDTSVIFGSERTTTTNTTALTATVLDPIAARLSFEIRHDSNVPPGSENTDTLTKASLVYEY
jgi:putative salt-induced outer membrane protein